MKSILLKAALLCLPFCVNAQTSFAPRDIKKLSVEELMNLEVTLVSRTPEKISEAPSAIQVITSEDIRRSGATNVPDALRLVPNLQVSQLSSSVWIISARGFNNIFSNKLLVMIDGRTVYTPLYAGVLWDQHNVLLEDIERIEVVSGPGGTLWGANAVNGIINIITKHTSETQGLYAYAAAGTFLKDQAAVRFGSKINDKISYKIYARHSDHGATKSATSNDNKDDWSMSNASFRMDWNPTKKNAYTVQGDYYDGNRNAPKDRSPQNGQNILARWTRTISDASDLTLQVYYDRYYREDAPTSSYDKINTVDIDFQHRLPLGRRNNFIWGAGYRYARDDANFPPAGGITPRFKRLDLYSAFVHDEFSLARNVMLSFGTKILHNVYTGLEWQPDVRLAWVNKGSTLWASISRAVRTPSRLDVDYFLPLTPQPPTTPSVAGGPNFISEKLVAYEAGYRFLPNALSAFSVSLFYNVYTDVYSVEALPGTVTYQIQNGSEAKSWGAEFSGNYQVTKSWRLRGGYTFFKKDLYAKPGHVFVPDYLGNDARNIGVLQSILDLPLNLQLDIAGRYVDQLPATFATPDIPSYFTYDARVAWVHKGFELSIAGQNLAHNKHLEFGSFYMPRSMYAKITARF